MKIYKEKTLGYPPSKKIWSDWARAFPSWTLKRSRLDQLKLPFLLNPSAYSGDLNNLSQTELVWFAKGQLFMITGLLKTAKTKHLLLSSSGYLVIGLNNDIVIRNRKHCTLHQFKGLMLTWLFEECWMLLINISSVAN